MAEILEDVAALTGKIESTYGTDSTPAAANAIFLNSPPTFKLVTGQHERRGQNSDASRKESRSGASWYEISLQFENKGSGAAGTAPEFGPLLQAAGYTETIDSGVSVTYTPNIGGKKGVTLWWYEDGLLYKARGCRGKASLQVDAGGYAMWTWEGKGMVSALPADTSMISSPVYDSGLPPANINGTFTWDSYAAELISFGFDGGNPVTEKKAHGETYGVSKIALGSFSFTGTMVVEKVLVAARPFETNLSNGTSGALNLVLGGTAGNITTITSSAMKLTGVTTQANGGVKELSCEFELSSTSSLNDAISVAYT